MQKCRVGASELIQRLGMCKSNKVFLPVSGNNVEHKSEGEIAEGISCQLEQQLHFKQSDETRKQTAEHKSRSKPNELGEKPPSGGCIHKFVKHEQRKEPDQIDKHRG